MEKDSTEVLLEGIDENNITSILQKWQEVNSILKELKKHDEILRTHLKVYLKERGWDNHIDERTGISVKLSIGKKQTIDETQLKIMLTDSQIAQVYRTTTFEKLMVLTPKARERMKKYVSKNNI